MSTVKIVHQETQNSQPGTVFHPANILIVDGELRDRETLTRRLERLGYACTGCENGREALDLLSAGNFDLVLADALMPGIKSSAFLKEALSLCPDIAVIFATSVVDIEVAVDSLKDGAYDFITKPFSIEEVSISVARALEKRRLLIDNRSYQQILEEQVANRTRQLKEALGVLEHTYHSTLVALSRALDHRDADSDGHSLRVTLYTKRLARQLGLSESQTRLIEQGVLLHDIGKIGIPDDLLQKRDKLSEEEWSLVRKHPENGYRILVGIKFLKGSAELVLHHHERYDGNGYPGHLKGDAINLGARIFSITDMLDDLTSAGSSFLPSIGFENAMCEIAKMAGAQLDPALVQEFLRIPASEWRAIRKNVAASTKRADFPRFETICRNP